jgi:hypothetical protein
MKAMLTVADRNGLSKITGKVFMARLSQKTLFTYLRNSNMPEEKQSLCFNDWNIEVCEQLAHFGTTPERERRVPYYEWWNKGVHPAVAAKCIITGETPDEVSNTKT